MKARKILVSVAALALVAAISIGGTLAWLTDKTVDVVNTFTVGNVNIKLDEAKVNDEGKPIDKQGNVVDVKEPADLAKADRIKGNEYKEVMPGYTYTKDPTVTVLEGSENCYVRMYVIVKNIDKLKAAIPGKTVTDEKNNEVFLLEELVGGWDKAVWQYAGYQGAGTVGVYEFRYVENGGIVSANTRLPALFTSFTVPGQQVGKTQLADLAKVQIEVMANAIQADGFTATVDADGNEKSAMENAWDSWDGSETRH